jgi:hypothetical protein
VGRWFELRAWMVLGVCVGWLGAELVVCNV